MVQHAENFWGNSAKRYQIYCICGFLKGAFSSRPRKVQLAGSNKVLEEKVKQLLGKVLWAAGMDPKSLQKKAKSSWVEVYQLKS